MPRARRRRIFARRRSRPLILFLLLVTAGAVVAVIVVTRPSKGRPRPLMSMFQDDAQLLNPSVAVVQRAVDQLQSLGVDRLRITVTWAYLAPAAGSHTPPANFNAENPADYPATAWAPYDRIAIMAAGKGMSVDFDLTAPAPLWAAAAGPPVARQAPVYRASTAAFAEFVKAVGKRYSGRYRIRVGASSRRFTLPRVGFWTIWNEPNQPGWLAPQWRVINGRRVPDAPRLYRAYADAAFASLKATGHRPGRDTILIGELAPEGCPVAATTPCQVAYPSVDDPIPPIPFLQDLYCLDATYRRLRGALAAALHCPTGGSRSAFVRAHPALFEPTGFAHHPYSFFLSPDKPFAPDSPEFVPLADLGRLERGLDRVFAAYGVSRRLPLYLTEYGYETNPPDPFKGRPLAIQALYLNEATYLAWKDQRVRALSQFLLVDSLPDRTAPPGTPAYWATFQTGLEFADGAAKPSLAAYRLPIYLPSGAGSGVAGALHLVWGMIRPGPNGSTQHATLQWRSVAGGRWRTVASVVSDQPDGSFEARVAVPGPGSIRIAWRSPGGALFYSRDAGIE
jgi:hypothetical protein